MIEEGTSGLTLESVARTNKFGWLRILRKFFKEGKFWVREAKYATDLLK